jgi:NAD(P)H-hydrate epimerase
MRAADEAAIAAGTEASVLMDRAGRAVARAVIACAGGRYGRRVTVVCGRGSNGGDGFVAARVLARRGSGVSCLGIGGAGESTGPAGDHLARMESDGIPLRPYAPHRLDDADVVVDALFGTGFRGRAEGEAAAAIAALNAAPATVVSVDVPSGVNGATGAVAGPAVVAQVTVALGAEKLGTAVTPGAAQAGRVEVADIGIPVERMPVAMVEPADVAAVLPRRPLDAHKRSGGSVAVLGGSAAITGAPVLTARGAARMGAGYVTVGGPSAVKNALSTTCPEVLTQVVARGDVLGPDAVAEFDPVLGRADALAIGPGVERGESQSALLEAVWSKVEIPVIVDADGLNALAGRSEWPRRTGATVLTPHPAELARLLESSVAEVSADRVGAARATASRFGAVVVLKGWRSVVAEPSGRVAVIPTGGAELATAGTGDVLTGAVAALAAAGLDPFAAAWAASYVHGVAGARAARRLGVAGVVAWDVAEALPEAFRVAAAG